MLEIVYFYALFVTLVRFFSKVKTFNFNSYHFSTPKIHFLIMMDRLIQEFPQQLKAAIEIGETITIKPALHPIHHILVLGVGGSGIGANFVAEFVKNELRSEFVQA